MEYLTVRQAAEAILRGEKIASDGARLEPALWLAAGSLDAKTCYRLSPNTITIGGMEVPEPLRTAPKNGTKYFVPALLSSSLVMEPIWGGDATDLSWLARGLAHMTKEAAIAHAKAIIKVSGGEV